MDSVFRVVTSGDGHYLGLAYCICTYDEWSNGCRPDCPYRHDELFTESLDVSKVRGIDVEQATQEQLAV